MTSKHWISLSDIVNLSQNILIMITRLIKSNEIYVYSNLKVPEIPLYMCFPQNTLQWQMNHQWRKMRIIIFACTILDWRLSVDSSICLLACRYPKIEFFHTDEIRTMMVDALFIYAKLNPDVAYRQVRGNTSWRLSVYIWCFSFHLFFSSFSDRISCSISGFNY